MLSKRYLVLPSMLASGWASLVEAAPPVIISQSGSLQVRVGDCFTAYVDASGDMLSYQWARDGVPLPGETAEQITVAEVNEAKAGTYQVTVSNQDGASSGEPVELKVTPPPVINVAAGGRGTISIPGHLACYDLSLPTNYATSTTPFPVIITSSPSGGGMVDHFRTVAEEKKWIVIGISQSKNGQESLARSHFIRAIFEHALANLKIDPNRIFVGGFSGGGLGSFGVAMGNAPLVAGVFSMGGWLGNNYNRDRDMYLPGILVARANGNSDAGANNYLSRDAAYLSPYLESGDLKDWSFTGGHVAAPAAVQREVFDWLIMQTPASTGEQRELAKRQEALWKARVTAGESAAVHEEVVIGAFGSPRTPLALAAWRTLDFLLANPLLFLREPPQNFPAFARRNHVALHHYCSSFAFLQQRDPSRQRSVTAAAMAFGDILWKMQWNRETEAESLFRHQSHTAFDAYVLDNALSDHPEPPHRGDWDGDGRDNFSEFVLGSDPRVADNTSPAEIQMVSGEVYASVPGARTGPMASVVPQAAASPGGPWIGMPEGRRGFQPHSDGSAKLTFSAGRVTDAPHKFVRFMPVMDQAIWHDANEDGIPYNYQFPRSSLFGEDPSGDLPTLPDARRETSVPGGAPLYLRYLAAAEVGNSFGFSPSSRYHPALAGYCGNLLHEVWMNVSGNTLSTAAAVMNNRAPDDVRLIPTTQAPWFTGGTGNLLGANYLERTRGYLVPGSTGNHVFSIAGDDQSELWLSTGEQRSGITLVASVATWSAYQNYTQTAEQTSPPIHLEAGRSYYLEILHKQGSGGEHCSVTWIVPGSLTRTLVPPANLRCLAANLIGW
jgi:hypothetical protein